MCILHATKAARRACVLDAGNQPIDQVVVAHLASRGPVVDAHASLGQTLSPPHTQHCVVVRQVLAIERQEIDTARRAARQPMLCAEKSVPRGVAGVRASNNEVADVEFAYSTRSRIPFSSRQPQYQRHCHGHSTPGSRSDLPVPRGGVKNGHLMRRFFSSSAGTLRVNPKVEGLARLVAKVGASLLFFLFFS